MNEQIITTTEVTIETTTENKQIERKKKYKKRRKINKAIKVTNSYLLYRIADYGILDKYLHGVIVDKDGNKTFYFDRHKDIEEIVNGFDESEFDG